MMNRNGFHRGNRSPAAAPRVIASGLSRRLTCAKGNASRPHVWRRLGAGFQLIEKISSSDDPSRRADPDVNTAELDFVAVEAARLAVLPAFPRAVREYTVATARFRESPRLANKLISYHTRWRVVGYLLYLAAD